MLDTTPTSFNRVVSIMIISILLWLAYFQNRLIKVEEINWNDSKFYRDVNLSQDKCLHNIRNSSVILRELVFPT